MFTTAHETPSLQGDVISSNPLIASRMALRPDFLGEIDESRLIGGFRDDLTNGDKLALQNFIVGEFGLEQLEVLRGTAEAAFVVERHERMHTQIDLLCVDVAVPRECEPALVARLLKLLSPKGIVCIESSDKTERIDADLLPASAFESVMAAPGFSVFAQIKGERSPRSVCYQIDLFRRQRYVARKRLARLAAEPKIPEVAVFVLTYKHEAYIAECLRTVMMQRGHFTMRVLIIDDASPDNTAQVARSVIEKNHNDRIKIELRVNPRNVGASANWGPALKWAEGADYVTFSDGDDFWSSKYRIQKHIDFLRARTDVLMSFNSFQFCANDSSARRKGIHLDTEIVSADRFVKDNPVGHLGATFYRGEIVEVFPLEPFYYINGDWMINVYCSQIGAMGYLDEALSVYRLHGGGVWGLKEGIDRILPTIDVILRYNAFTDYNFNNQFNWLIRDRFRALGAFLVDSADDVGTVDLIIIYDGFPDRDDFFYAEVTSYLREFPSSLMLATLHGDYQRQHPELGSRVIEDDGTFPLHLGKLVYVATLKQTYAALAKIEAAHVPFVFSLSPDGDFAINNPNVDAQLKRIFRSPCFKKVIVTQQAIYDYVVRKELCPPEKIEFIHGGAMPEIPEGNAIPKRRWGFGKARLDICFMARKVAPFDNNAGYDVFVEVAKALQHRHDDICFHMVGAVSPCAVNVASLGDRIKFYGSLTSDRFEGFFREMDIILSPNVSSRPYLGAIDSFPTDRCVEAGARGIAIFAIDEFNAAKDRFTDGEDIVLVKPGVADIVAKIERYYADPGALKTIGERGAQSIRALYCPEAQMTPRIHLLREAIRNSAPVGETQALRVKLAHRDEQLAALQSELAYRDEQLAAVTAKQIDCKLRSPALSWLERFSSRFRRRKGLADPVCAAISSSGLFDGDWYLRTNPDVAQAGLDPVVHYFLHGAAEGRDPGPFFSTRGYLSANPDVDAAGMNPLFHYLRFGIKERRRAPSGK
jgi:glycosyltransferase involved in cell wall biosynthesis